ELGLEYVDLYLIHWPLKLNQDDVKSPLTKENIAAINLKDVWEGMEKCQALGLTKSIGVSNFYPRLIEEILSFAKIPPVVNQVEMNPLWQQKNLNNFCKKNDILLTAYSPLGAFATEWGHNRVMECDVLQDIAKSRGKTVAQISLRWIYEQGVSFVVKSFNTERMKQNLDIFDWSLTEDELIKISQIPQQRHVYLSGTMLKEPHDVLAEIDAEISSRTKNNDVRKPTVPSARNIPYPRQVMSDIFQNTSLRVKNMVSIPVTTISSSNGRQPIPLIGLGTATFTESGDKVKAAVIEAIKVGYRHFDTAAAYGTEKPLGEAIKEALRLGLIKSRAELFITTKLWCYSTEGHLVVPAIKKSLLNLGLEYVDLYLIHWPLKCVAAINIRDVWEGMEKCQDLGFTKSIGVSNFSPPLIEEILSFAKIPPAVNQVEMNPLWQQKKLNEFCKKNDILLTGYSPLGASGARWGDNRVIECDVLQDIAKSREKTVAQVSLRWMYEQGVSFVVKSFNYERMKQNLDIFDWSLTEEELVKISQIPQKKHIYIAGSLVEETNDIIAEIDAGLAFQ
ncbi:hypothetical protein M8C21_027677, partial [Ambrosia artemisiifolia]